MGCLGGLILLPFYIIGFVIYVGIYAVIGAIYVGAFIIGIIIALIGAIIDSIAKKEKEKIFKESNINSILNEIDNLDGFKFEEFTAEILKKNDFKNVKVTKGSGDFGADVIATKNNVRYAFQCKRFNSRIGPKSIGEVLRGMNRYQCDVGIVVTNNYFTNQAIEEAKISNIILWDRNSLIELIKNIQNK